MHADYLKKLFAIRIFSILFIAIVEILILDGLVLLRRLSAKAYELIPPATLHV
jgi:hypothetical protein